MHQLTRGQQRILWHQQLSHMHSRRVSEAHTYATPGIPNVPIATDLDKCPICLQSKLHLADRSQEASPYKLCTGRKPNLSMLRVFGCRVYALPARPHRPDMHLYDASHHQSSWLDPSLLPSCPSRHHGSLQTLTP
jgi:hypothetical protein